MTEIYQMTIAGCKRQLPICPIDEHLDIAGFVMFGDVGITERAAEELLARYPEHDVVITVETKGVPLCYEMARRGCHRHVVARKSVKAYMHNCIHVEVKSITTDHAQDLYLSKDDYKDPTGKRILIVNDVISTDESLAAIEKLVHEFGGNVVSHVYVLAEGDAVKRDDIVFLEPLSLFLE